MVIVAVEVRVHTVLPQDRVQEGHEGCIVAMISVAAHWVVCDDEKPAHALFPHCDEAPLQPFELALQLRPPSGRARRAGAPLQLFHEMVLVLVAGLGARLVQVLLGQRGGIEKRYSHEGRSAESLSEEELAFHIGVPPRVSPSQRWIHVARHVVAAVLVIAHDAMPGDVQRRQVFGRVNSRERLFENIVRDKRQAAVVKGIADVEDGLRPNASCIEVHGPSQAGLIHAALLFRRVWIPERSTGSQILPATAPIADHK
mmetsp:Transcript_74097/g.205917  ORF Transcript_74097/g.205917 Transcript_74097/m.205917 type:complete len:257 (+) Transcript_74097:845-1615(+)